MRLRQRRHLKVDGASNFSGVRGSATWTRTFKLSNDPAIEKVRDTFLRSVPEPAGITLWCCVGIIARFSLNRTQPVLPMGLGYVEGVTHDYVRNGTTTLFAALDIATGTVFTDKSRGTVYQEFLSFSLRLDDCIPSNWTFTLSSITTQPTNSNT